MYQTLQYAENDKKTDEKLYVSAINCPVQRAYEHMMTTKLHYGKLGGNVAYHGFQSFKENEVAPEECHSIGVETAKKMELKILREKKVKLLDFLVVLVIL